MPEVTLTRDEAERFLCRLERGERRAAWQNDQQQWIVDQEVKQSILHLFRLSSNQSLNVGPFSFCDRDLIPPQDILADGVRVVPGGTAIRRGAHLASGVVIMPPAYVNIGAFVDADSMIDSHVLVGSCAQIGKRVHLSAGVQIGGVLEPIGALPVIVEDDAFLGGLSGIFEGVRIGQQAVVAAGVILTASKPVYDLVNQCQLAPVDGVLAIPPRAVVIGGSRSGAGEFARQHHLSSDVALIVKYRDPATDARVTLEGALR